MEQQNLINLLQCKEDKKLCAYFFQFCDQHELYTLHLKKNISPWKISTQNRVI